MGQVSAKNNPKNSQNSDLGSRGYYHNDPAGDHSLRPGKGPAECYLAVFNYRSPKAAFQEKAAYLPLL